MATNMHFIRALCFGSAISFLAFPVAAEGPPCLETAKALASIEAQYKLCRFAGNYDIWSGDLYAHKRCQTSVAPDLLKTFKSESESALKARMGTANQRQFCAGIQGEYEAQGERLKAELVGLRNVERKREASERAAAASTPSFLLSMTMGGDHYRPIAEYKSMASCESEGKENVAALRRRAVETGAGTSANQIKHRCEPM